MQYQSEYRNTIESVVNMSKYFTNVFMGVIKLFMTIPGHINFMQIGR